MRQLTHIASAEPGTGLGVWKPRQDGLTVMNGRGDRVVALDLMRLALPLLDRAGEATAAARLQSAIDCAELGREGLEPISAATEDKGTWSIVVPLPNRPRPA